MNRKHLAITGVIVVLICQAEATVHYLSWGRPVVLLGFAVNAGLTIWSIGSEQARN
jgi:hypothetical protein